MPDEEAPDGAQEKPPGNPFVNPIIHAPENQQPAHKQNDGAPPNNQDEATKLQQDIRTGEKWLIGIQCTTLVFTAIVAWIYYGQLTQMRIATEASAKAANAASEAVDTSMLNMDRQMQQVVNQTASQARFGERCPRCRAVRCTFR
jgi:hypothetical protein